MLGLGQYEGWTLLAQCSSLHQMNSDPGGANNNNILGEHTKHMQGEFVVIAGSEIYLGCSRTGLEGVLTWICGWRCVFCPSENTAWRQQHSETGLRNKGVILKQEESHKLDVPTNPTTN